MIVTKGTGREALEDARRGVIPTVTVQYEKQIPKKNSSKKVNTRKQSLSGKRQQSKAKKRPQREERK